MAGSVQSARADMDLGEDTLGDAEMGPGMDLILSLLAVTIMILAFSLIEKEQASSPPDNDRTLSTEPTNIHTDIEWESIVASLQIERKELATRVVRLEAELTRSTAAESRRISDIRELSEQVDELENALKEASALITAENLASRNHARNEEEITQRQEELAAREARLDEQAEQLESLRKSSTREQHDNPATRSEADKVVLQDSAEVAIFEPGSATLSADGRRRIRALVPRLVEVVRERSGNVLSVAGYSSAEPFRPVAEGQRLDANLELSVKRALSVASTLRLAGLPEECLLIEGFGRSRSSIIGDLLGEATVNLSYWDRAWTRADDSARSAYRQELVSQRRVELVVLSDAESLCGNRQLRRALERVGDALGG